MMAVFSEFIKEIVEVFVDDFSVYGKMFVDCLANLDKVLTRCADVDWVPNWEKCHFMVKKGIVLGHVISERGIKVDKAKVETVLMVKIRQPSHDFTFGVGISFIPYPLELTPVV
jgi:hypothetical protein